MAAASDPKNDGRVVTYRGQRYRISGGSLIGI
jgi:hypothetical protein